ncbi:MAG: NYN domain-containing protein [Chloroflexota bacterium]|nr:NYN domain-containing protein [Chloroflexia bacterium]MDQ3444512.1 NYN domain-containing protein [Chloroflexota bacterium]
MVSDTSGTRSGHGNGDSKEVAVFVDFENIRYSTINSFGREPDPITWRDKALEYGLMSVARAYADFDQHPLQARTRLDVAGFESHHYPAKRTTDSHGREKFASRSDLNLVVDIINTALVRPDIEIFLLFTGDKDFIRLVTTLRNRLGRRVVICGVPGSISPDLVAAAGEEDMLEMSQSADVDMAVIKAIDTYIKQLHPGFVPTQSHMSRTLWRFLDRNSLPSEHIEAKVMEFLRKGVLSKRQTINGQGQELVTTEINMEHPLVIKALPVIVDDLLDTVESGDDDDVVVSADVPEIGDGVAMRGASSGAEAWEPASETSRYQRRFSSGSGAWRGRSNVRNGSRPDER